MSYSISLIDSEGTPVQVDLHEEGATYPMGGTTLATMDITYNYSKFYYDMIDEELGIRWLYDKQGYDCIEILEHAVEILGVYTDDDYWEPTPGNAGHALDVLLTWAKQHGDAVFKGD